MNGLKFRYRPVDEVVREIENCGSRTISINDADFFGTPERPKEVMRALKGRGIQWQAGVTSKLANDDRMLELAAESGCTRCGRSSESPPCRRRLLAAWRAIRIGTFACIC